MSIKQPIFGDARGDSDCFRLVFTAWTRSIAPPDGAGHREIADLADLRRQPTDVSWLWIKDDPIEPDLPSIQRWLAESPSGRGTIIGGDRLQGCGYRYSGERLWVGAWCDWPLLAVGESIDRLIAAWDPIVRAHAEASSEAKNTRSDGYLLFSNDHDLRVAAEDGGVRTARLTPLEFPPCRPRVIVLDLAESHSSSEFMLELLDRLRIAYPPATILAAESFPRWNAAAERLSHGVVTFERIHFWRFLPVV